jgi:hypothetical protein
LDTNYFYIKNNLLSELNINKNSKISIIANNLEEFVLYFCNNLNFEITCFDMNSSLKNINKKINYYNNLNKFKNEHKYLYKYYDLVLTHNSTWFKTKINLSVNFSFKPSVINK